MVERDRYAIEQENVLRVCKSALVMRYCYKRTKVGTSFVLQRIKCGFSDSCDSDDTVRKERVWTDRSVLKD